MYTPMYPDKEQQTKVDGLLASFDALINKYGPSKLDLIKPMLEKKYAEMYALWRETSDPSLLLHYKTMRIKTNYLELISIQQHFQGILDQITTTEEFDKQDENLNLSMNSAFRFAENSINAAQAGGLITPELQEIQNQIGAMHEDMPRAYLVKKMSTKLNSALLYQQSFHAILDGITTIDEFDKQKETLAVHIDSVMNIVQNSVKESKEEEVIAPELREINTQLVDTLSDLSRARLVKQITLELQDSFEALKHAQMLPYYDEAVDEKLAASLDRIKDHKSLLQSAVIYELNNEAILDSIEQLEKAYSDWQYSSLYSTFYMEIVSSKTYDELEAKAQKLTPLVPKMTSLYPQASMVYKALFRAIPAYLSNKQCELILSDLKNTRITSVKDITSIRQQLFINLGRLDTFQRYLPNSKELQQTRAGMEGLHHFFASVSSYSSIPADSLYSNLSVEEINAGLFEEYKKQLLGQLSHYRNRYSILTGFFVQHLRQAKNLASLVSNASSFGELQTILHEEVFCFTGNLTGNYYSLITKAEFAVSHLDSLLTPAQRNLNNPFLEDYLKEVSP